MLRSFLQRCPACRIRKPMERMCVELLRIRLPQSPRKRGETRRRSGYGARSPMVLSEGIRRRTRSCPRSSIRNPGWLHASAGWLRLGIDPNAPIHGLRLECRNLLRKRRRRTSRFRQILITVPGASHASVDDLAFSQRTILVAAHIRNRGDLSVKFEDGDTLAAHGDNRRAFLRNAFHRAGVNKSFTNRIQFFPINLTLARARREMQTQDAYKSGAGCNRQHRASLRLQQAQRDVANQKGVRHVDQHMKGLPDGRSQVPQPEIMTGGCHEKKNQEGQKTELLEGEVGQAAEVLIRRQEADERVFISEAMKLNDRKDSVRCAQQKSDDSQMAAIVQQGKKSRIQPAKRPDAQNHVQKQKRR